MLQNLLAERFKLTLHRGTKIVPLYELSVAKNGPKLTVSKGNSPPGSSPPQLPLNTKIGVDKNGFPILAEGVGNASRIMNGHVFVTARGQPLSVVTNVLEQQGLGVDAVGLPIMRVIDKTGLTGRYDFYFDFAQRQMEGAVPIDSPSDRGPDVFSAVYDQLGLKLEPKKGPVEMLIIDHVDKVPTEN